MADTIKLPGLGETKKATAALIVVGGLGLAFVIYRHRQNSATAPVDTSALDTTGANGGIDPNTGLPLGSPEDQAALAAQFSGGFGSTGIGPFDSGFSTNPFGVIPSSNPSGAITTNADWDAQALQNLEAIGFGSEAAATALARYLGKLTLNSEQAQMVQIAVAETGPPPVGTFAIRTAPTPVKKPAEVKVPDVRGEELKQAIEKLHADGFNTHVNGVRKPGVTNFVTSTSLAGGTKTHKGATVTINFRRKFQR